MKQVTRCEFGGGLSEVSLNRLIIKLIKKNIRIPSGSQGNQAVVYEDSCFSFLYDINSMIKRKFVSLYKEKRTHR